MKGIDAAGAAVGLVLLIAGAARAQLRPAAATRPTVDVPKAATAPAIDGKLDAPVWRQAAQVTVDRTIEKDLPAEASTDVLLLWDDQALYVGLRCHEPAMDRLVPGETGQGVPVWKADSLELFVGQVQRYYCFGVNAAGGTMCSLGKDMSRPIEFQAAVAREPDAWTATFALPLAKMADDRPTEWIANFCRTRHAGAAKEETAWVPTHTKTSHLPEKLGVLRLQAPKGDPAAVPNVQDAKCASPRTTPAKPGVER